MSYSQKKINVSKALIKDSTTLHNKISNILKSGQITNQGPTLKLLEKKLKHYLGIKNINLFCNGTMALMIALKSLDVKGEVITTPFTFPATIHALQWMGIKPVFCDIDKNTMCIDTKKIENLITKKTSAILGVHVYGMPCDVKNIDLIAKRNNLKVIYDAAHCFVSKINGKHISSYGDISMLSFHAAKLFNTLEGGALVYKDKTLSKKIYLSLNFGISNHSEITTVGINGKMNEVQAAFGLENLKLINKEVLKRQKVIKEYDKFFDGYDNILTLDIPKNTTPSYQYYPVRFDRSKISRNQVHDQLKKKNIDARKYFYPLLSNVPPYNKSKSAQKDKLLNANQIADNILCLPLYGDLKIAQVKNICSIIKKIIDNNK